MNRKRERSEVSLVTLAEQHCSDVGDRAHQATVAAADAMQVASAIDSACDALAYAESMAAVFDGLGLRREDMDPQRGDYFPYWVHCGPPFVHALRSYSRAGLLCTNDDACECVEYAANERVTLAFVRFLRGTPASAAARRALTRYVQAARRLDDGRERDHDKVRNLQIGCMDALGATPLAAQLAAVLTQETE